MNDVLFVDDNRSHFVLFVGLVIISILYEVTGLPPSYPDPYHDNTNDDDVTSVTYGFPGESGTSGKISLN